MYCSSAGQMCIRDSKYVGVEPSKVFPHNLRHLFATAFYPVSYTHLDVYKRQEQRRLEIARALASEPQLLLLDEPAAGMNSTEKVELTEMIRKIRDAGITILLVEHDMKLVMRVTDRIAVLNFGKMIALDEPEAIQNNPEVIEMCIRDRSWSLRTR